MGVDAVASFIQPRQETPSIVDTLVAMNPDARKQIIQSELYGKRFRPAADAHRVYKMFFGGYEERYLGAFHEHPWSQRAEKDLELARDKGEHFSNKDLKARLEPRMYDKHTLVADASPFALAVNRATAKLELQETHELRNDLSFPDQPLKGMNIILSVEIGGTNIYWAMVDISADGSTTIAKYSSVPFPRTEFGSPLDFFATVIGHITKEMEQTISETPYDAISIVYSYEHTNAPRHAGQPGLDAQPVIPMGKGFIVPNIDAIFVGEQLQDDLSIAYSENPPDSRLPYVVLNDAVAVLLSADAHIGGIIGTGVNFAIIVNGRIINLEAGNFDDVPIHAYAQRIDKTSENPGKHLAEKQVGGKYLGLTLEEILRDFSDTGIVPFRTKDDAQLTAETITNILDGNVQALSTVFDASEEQIQDNFPILFGAATRLRERAAQIVGCMIAAVMRTYPHEFRDAPPIPMEGSVFYGMPGFKETVRSTVEERTNQEVQFTPKTHKPGIRGAGKLALRFRKIHS